jgi:hypothetical protein
MLVNNTIESNLIALWATTPNNEILASFKMLVKKLQEYTVPKDSRPQYDPLSAVFQPLIRMRRRSYSFLIMLHHREKYLTIGWKQNILINILFI